MKKSAVGVSLVALASLVACMPASVDEHHRQTVTVEPRTHEDRVAVLANIDAIMADALEIWSRAHPPATALAPLEISWDRARGGTVDEELMRHDDEPVGTTSVTGADVPASAHPSKPTPTAPPRSAAEAAERNGATTGQGEGSAGDIGLPAASPRGTTTATPRPMAPTSPAETASPFR